MNGCQAALVTGVHGLQHVERLRPAALADQNAIRPHTQGVADQVPCRHLADAFDVGGARFQPADMRLLQAQLGGIFNGHNALILRNGGRKGV